MFRELLSGEFAPYGQLTHQQLDQLEGHYELLLKWNERINLTRISGLKDVVQLHYCESLFVATMLPAGRLRIVDVGSGAGFPGIPIAVLRPESDVMLVESHQRKAVFLHEASRALSNVRVLSSRAEDVMEEFDWLVSRAVAPQEVRSLNLASNAAILGASQKGALKLPWGNSRFLSMFHVEH